MFRSRYPRTRLTHVRVLQSFGSPRGQGITPVPGPALEPPEIVHQHSLVSYTPEVGKVYIIEWTGNETDLHDVFFS